MSDYANAPHVTLVFGKGRSGKTSLVYKFLLNVADECAAIFIYDKSGQAAKRLRLHTCGTARECEEAKPGKWICFNPHRMFPAHKLADGFAWFCRWCLESAKSGPGRKILFVDELWDECTPHNFPDDLLAVVKTGRFDALEFIGVTHRPREFPMALRSAVTEWVCFHTAEKVELDVLGEYCPRPERVAALPTVGRFLAFNRESGGELFGGFSDAPGGWSEFKPTI